MRSIIWIVSLTVALGVLVARYADKVVNAPARNSDSSEATMTRSSSMTAITVPQPSPEPPPSPRTQAPSKPALPEIIRMSPSSGRSVTLRDDSRGHYRTEARVDGMKIEFLVDTGATAVMLSANTAAKLGIRPARSDYTAKVMTGNGEIRAAVVQLNKIELGDITVRDVRALVYSDEKTEIDLLGMTFLSRVRWTHDRGRLIIEQQSNN